MSLKPGASLSLLAAAALAASSAPAMAKWGTRSGASLPAQSFSTRSFSAPSIFAPSAPTSGLSTPQAVSAQPSSFGFGQNRPPLFFFLPARIVDRLENLFTRGGKSPHGLCYLFDFSYCGGNDSPG